MKEYFVKFRNNLEAIVKEKGHPSCFEGKVKYVRWLEGEKKLHTLDFRKNICEDCTIGFQKKMISVGNCVNPDFLTKEDDD